MIPAPSPSNLEDLGMRGASRRGCYWGKRIHKKEVPRHPLPDSSRDSSLLHLRWNIVQRQMEVKFWFSHRPVQQKPLNLAKHGIPMMGIRSCWSFKRPVKSLQMQLPELLKHPLFSFSSKGPTPLFGNLSLGAVIECNWYWCMWNKNSQKSFWTGNCWAIGRLTSH